MKGCRLRRGEGRGARGSGGREKTAGPGGSRSQAGGIDGWSDGWKNDEKEKRKRL